MPFHARCELPGALLAAILALDPAVPAGVLGFKAGICESWLVGAEERWPLNCYPPPTADLPTANCRGLLAQYRPERLLVVAEARELSGVAKAAHHFDQVGAGLGISRLRWLPAASTAPTTRSNRPAASTRQPAPAAALPLMPHQVPLPRGLWDDSNGYVTLTKYALAEARAGLEAGMMQGLAGGYLAYAAAGALLRCARSVLGWQ